MADKSKYLSSSDVIKGTLILILIIFFFSLTTDSVLGGSASFNLELAANEYLGILTHLAIIALITERFVEIFTSVIRKPKRIELEGDVREAAESEDTQEKNKALECLDAYRARTGIFAMTISFITGLIVASVGIHVLDPLFIKENLSPIQLKLFSAIDIVITAGLIAGGSKGVNALTSSIGAVFDAMKFQSRATQEKARRDMTDA